MVDLMRPVNNKPPRTYPSIQYETVSLLRARPLFKSARRRWTSHPSLLGTGPPDLRLRLHSGQDLLGRLGLLPAFDELVRPYIRIPEGDKGKGKQVEVDGQIVELGLQVQDQDEPHEEHTKGWREFASAIPGSS